MRENRWVRYEEHVETWAQRWSQPHASTPSLKDLLRLKRLVGNDERAMVMVDVEADDISAIIHIVCVELVKKQMVNLEKGECGLYLLKSHL